MIEITTPLQHDFLISLLDGKEIDGITYTFVRKKGSMKLLFNAEGEGDKVAPAKKAIKNTEIGSVLYFQIGEAK